MSRSHVKRWTPAFLPSLKLALRPLVAYWVVTVGGFAALFGAIIYTEKSSGSEIGKILRVHESTISRRLEKLLKVLRKQVMAGLMARGMNRGQAEEALESDVRYIQVDVTRKLQENRRAAFQEDKGSS